MRNSQIASTGIVIGVVLLGVGIIMRVLHWEGQQGILIGAIVLIVLSYVFRFSLKSPKTGLDVAKLAVAILWPSSYLFGLLHLPYGVAFMTLATLSILVFFVLYIREKIKEKHPDLVESIVSLVATIGILGGTFFKILHLAYATQLMNIGMLALGYIIIQSVFKDPNKSKD